MLSKKQIEQLASRQPSGRNRLSVAIEIAGVTQVQLAEKTGFTQSYISRVQNGRYADLPGETMRTFAEYFGCAIEDLFPGRAAVAS